jgi:hypothetical protein
LIPNWTLYVLLVIYLLVTTKRNGSKFLLFLPHGFYLWMTRAHHT